MGAQTKIPELFAEQGCIFVKKAGKLDLHGFDIGLRHSTSVTLKDSSIGECTYISGSLDQVKAELSDDIIFGS